IIEGAAREFKEETDLDIIEPKLQGVFSFLMYDGDTLENEWMMYTFVSKNYEGTLTSYCPEGILEWVPVKDILKVPMAEGDREIFKHVLTKDDILYGTFSYTTEVELIKFRKSSM